MATGALNMGEWIEANEVVLWWMLVTSSATFVAALIGAPLWVINIPPDYFSDKKHKHPSPFNYGMTGTLLAIGRNLLGGILLLIGLLMLILPGQGLLTILVGVMLMDIPGKYRIARWIVVRPPVLQSMNWIRRRADRAPLVLDE
jgi:hypothetical protein